MLIDSAQPSVHGLADAAHGLGGSTNRLTDQCTGAHESESDPIAARFLVQRCAKQSARERNNRSYSRHIAEVRFLHCLLMTRAPGANAKEAAEYV